MKVIFLYYIQEADKLTFISKWFNLIQLEGEKIILPIKAEEKIDSKKAQKLAQKTKKIFEKTRSKKIVISEEIQEQEEYMNLLYTYDLEIIEGKWLFEALACQALEYLLKKKAMKKEETKISILVNDLSENMLANVRKIAKEYKMVSIVTNHREKFKKIEKQILEEDGIMITVGNNKKKAIAKAELILNVDFPSELIHQYTIYDKAILLNIRGNVKITNKRFEGITINDYEVVVNREEAFDYDKKTKYKAYQIYEAQINKRQPYEELMKQMERDKVEIIALLGTNTKI